MPTFAVTDAGWTELSSGDLPASGVTAGTYGDSTHVGQFTVDASGIVTAASDVAISGGGGSSGLVQLFDQTLAVDAAVIDTGAGGIAAGHGTLVVVLYARIADVVAFADIGMVLNGDTAGHYYRQRLRAANSTVTAAIQSAGTFGVQFTCPANNDAANNYGTTVCYIPNYDNATNYKSGTVSAGAMDTTAANSLLDYVAFLWTNTAAISQATFRAVSGADIKAGTRVTIYGTA